jgi:hypothetical protein
MMQLLISLSVILASVQNLGINGTPGLYLVIWSISTAALGLLIWIAESLPKVGDWWVRRNELKLVVGKEEGNHMNQRRVNNLA